MFAENPFLLIYQGRLRRQRKAGWLATGLVSVGLGVFAGLICTAGHHPAASISLATVLLSACLCLFGWSQSCIAQAVMGLGQNGNLEEMVPANLAPTDIADSATAFLARRWLKLTPWVLLGALLPGNAWATGIILTFWLLMLPGGCSSVYAATVQLLIREGQIPWSRVLSRSLRGALLVLLALIPLAFCRSGGQMMAWTFFMVVVLNLHGMYESRRLVVEWLSNPRPSSGSSSRKRAGATSPGWMVGAAANPMLFRYQLTRRRWLGLPAWLVLSSICGLTMGGLSFLSLEGFHVLAFYVLMGVAGLGVTLHLRYLDFEMRNGNYELISTTRSPRELVDNLAQVGYLPRLLEVVPAAAIVLFCLTIGQPAQAGLIAGGSLMLALWWVVQARLSSYVNVICAIGLHHRAQGAHLNSLALLIQLAVLVTPFVVAGLATMTLAYSQVPVLLLPTSAILEGVLCLACLSYTSRRWAVRLAS